MPFLLLKRVVNPERLSYHMPVMCRFRACRLPFLSETRRDARAKGTLPDGGSCGEDG